MRAKFSSILFVAVFVASSIDSVAAESKATPRLRRQDDKTTRYLTTATTTETASHEERMIWESVKNLFSRSEKLNVEPKMDNIEATARAARGATRIGNKRENRALKILGVSVTLVVVLLIVLGIFGVIK